MPSSSASGGTLQLSLSMAMPWSPPSKLQGPVRRSACAQTIEHRPRPQRVCLWRDVYSSTVLGRIHRELRQAPRAPAQRCSSTTTRSDSSGSNWPLVGMSHFSSNAIEQMASPPPPPAPSPGPDSANLPPTAAMLGPLSLFSSMLLLLMDHPFLWSSNSPFGRLPKPSSGLSWPAPAGRIPAKCSENGRMMLSRSMCAQLINPRLPAYPPGLRVSDASAQFHDEKCFGQLGALIACCRNDPLGPKSQPHSPSAYLPDLCVSDPSSQFHEIKGVKQSSACPLRDPSWQTAFHGGKLGAYPAGQGYPHPGSPPLMSPISPVTNFHTAPPA